MRLSTLSSFLAAFILIGFLAVNVQADTNNVSSNVVVGGVTVVMDTNKWINGGGNGGYWDVIYPKNSKKKTRDGEFVWITSRARIQDAEQYKILRVLMRDKNYTLAIGYITAIFDSGTGLTYELALKMHQVRIACLAQLGYTDAASNIIEVVASNPDLPISIRNYVKYYTLGLNYSTKTLSEDVIQRFEAMVNAEEEGTRTRRMAELAEADALYLDKQVDRSFVIYKRICDQKVRDDVSLLAYESQGDIMKSKKASNKVVNALYIQGLLLSSDTAWYGDIARVFDKVVWEEEVDAGKTMKQIYDLIPPDEQSQEFVKMLKNKLYLLGELN